MKPLKSKLLFCLGCIFIVLGNAEALPEEDIALVESTLHYVRSAFRVPNEERSRRDVFTSNNVIYYEVPEPLKEVQKFLFTSSGEIIVSLKEKNSIESIEDVSQDKTFSAYLTRNSFNETYERLKNAQRQGALGRFPSSHWFLVEQFLRAWQQIIDYTDPGEQRSIEQELSFLPFAFFSITPHKKHSMRLPTRFQVGIFYDYTIRIAGKICAVLPKFLRHVDQELHERTLVKNGKLYRPQEIICPNFPSLKSSDLLLCNVHCLGLSEERHQERERSREIQIGYMAKNLAWDGGPSVDFDDFLQSCAQTFQENSSPDLVDDIAEQIVILENLAWTSIIRIEEFFPGQSVKVVPFLELTAKRFSNSICEHIKSKKELQWNANKHEEIWENLHDRIVAEFIEASQDQLCTFFQEAQKKMILFKKEVRMSFLENLENFGLTHHKKASLLSAIQKNTRKHLFTEVLDLFFTRKNNALKEIPSQINDFGKCVFNTMKSRRAHISRAFRKAIAFLRNIRKELKNQQSTNMKTNKNTIQISRTQNNNESTEMDDEDQEKKYASDKERDYSDILKNGVELNAQAKDILRKIQDRDAFTYETLNIAKKTERILKGKAYRHSYYINFDKKNASIDRVMKAISRITRTFQKSTQQNVHRSDRMLPPQHTNVHKVPSIRVDPSLFSHTQQIINETIKFLKLCDEVGIPLSNKKEENVLFEALKKGKRKNVGPSIWGGFLGEKQDKDTMYQLRKGEKTLKTPIGFIVDIATEVLCAKKIRRDLQNFESIRSLALFRDSQDELEDLSFISSLSSILFSTSDNAEKFENPLVFHDNTDRFHFLAGLVSNLLLSDPLKTDSEILK